MNFTPSPILLHDSDDRFPLLGSANRRQNRPKFRRQNDVVEVSEVGLLNQGATLSDGIPRGFAS
jgi:hypothetical protein